VFDDMVSNGAPRPIPPPQLLKAQLLVALLGIPPRRLLCEAHGDSRLLRWFLDLAPGDGVPDPELFESERRRLAASVVGRCFLEAVLAAHAAAPATPAANPIDATPASW
jgi:hypothetical protein